MPLQSIVGYSVFQKPARFSTENPLPERGRGHLLPSREGRRTLPITPELASGETGGPSYLEQHFTALLRLWPLNLSAPCSTCDRPTATAITENSVSTHAVAPTGQAQ